MKKTNKLWIPAIALAGTAAVAAPFLCLTSCSKKDVQIVFNKTQGVPEFTTPESSPDIGNGCKVEIVGISSDSLSITASKKIEFEFHIGGNSKNISSDGKVHFAIWHGEAENPYYERDIDFSDGAMKYQYTADSEQTIADGDKMVVSFISNQKVKTGHYSAKLVLNAQ